MRNATHDYTTHLQWEGNTGSGTRDYNAYRREYRITMAGKPELHASADPAFRGDPTLPNPEDLFLASVSACHMHFYLALCARYGLVVLTYEDQAQARMETGADSGRFVEIVLNPRSEHLTGWAIRHWLPHCTTPRTHAASSPIPAACRSPPGAISKWRHCSACRRERCPMKDLEIV